MGVQSIVGEALATIVSRERFALYKGGGVFLIIAGLLVVTSSRKTIKSIVEANTLRDDDTAEDGERELVKVADDGVGTLDEE